MNRARRRNFGCAVLVAVAALAQSAAAQQSQADPVKRVLQATGLRARVGPMPNFVERSRPPAGALHYVPLGAARPEPSDKPLSPAQIRAEEAQLAGVRAQDDRLSGRKPVVVVARSAAGRQPKAEKKKVRPCVLTCKIDMTGIGRTDSMR